MAAQRGALRFGEGGSRGDFRAGEAQTLVDYQFEAVNNFCKRADAAMVHQHKEQIARNPRKAKDIANLSDYGAFAAGGNGRSKQRVLQLRGRAQGGFESSHLRYGVLGAEGGAAGSYHVDKGVGVSRGYGRECHFKSCTKLLTRPSSAAGDMCLRIFCSAKPIASPAA